MCEEKDLCNWALSHRYLCVQFANHGFYELNIITCTNILLMQVLLSSRGEIWVCESTHISDLGRFLKCQRLVLAFSLTFTALLRSSLSVLSDGYKD